MRHVLRAESGKGSEKEAEKDGLGGDQEMFTDTKGVKVPVEGGFEEQNEFIEFDHGTPADPESESEEDHGSASASGSGSEEEDEETSDQTEIEAEAEDGKHPEPFSPQPGLTEDEDEDEVLGIVM